MIISGRDQKMILLDYHEMGLKSEPLLSGDLTIDEYLKRVS